MWNRKDIWLWKGSTPAGHLANVHREFPWFDNYNCKGDCSIIKNPHFGSPPPFFKIFFFGPRPSLQKITNANTNTKIIFWRQTKTDKMTCIFFIGRWLQIWHLVDSLLTPCWQLVNTLLTPCWHLADTLLVIFSNVQLYNCNNLTFLCNAFLPLPNVFMQSGFSPVNVTKYFLLTFLMFTAIIELLISTLIFVKEGVGIRIQSNKPVSHNLVIGMLEWLSLIMITKTD